MYHKKDRKKSDTSPSLDDVSNQHRIEIIIKGLIADLLEVPYESLDFQASFLDLGINSVQTVTLVEMINDKLGIVLGIEVIFDFRSLSELVAHIVSHNSHIVKADHGNKYEDKNTVPAENVSAGKLVKGAAHKSSLSG